VVALVPPAKVDPPVLLALPVPQVKTALTERPEQLALLALPATTAQMVPTALTALTAQPELPAQLEQTAAAAPLASLP